ncbi:MAG TPA: SO_0444 family Cu/Zn efflux transporter [bacterium]|nr:SO_0444 family Cu/Zn efflux transporter [bacterium]
MLQSIFISIADTLVDASFYLLIGFILAGILRSLFTVEMLGKHLGDSSWRSVWKAALIGVPLPLCSCSVVPVGISLKKNGASNGATMSFLVSTPETGVDSIAVSYAFLDPIMTIIRPIAAFITAIVSGSLENIFGSQKQSDTVQQSDAPQTSCNCSTNCNNEADKTVESRFDRLKSGIVYAFTDLLGDVAYYLLLGLIASGILSAIIPENFFIDVMHSPLVNMMIMLAVGIPIYVCASASTPIAAALIMKGITPGAALIFLLAGPATNISTIALVRSKLGQRSLIIYLFSIAMIALAMGSLTDSVYSYFDIKPQVSIGTMHDVIPESIHIISAVIFLPILLLACFREIRHRFFK